VAGSLPGQLCRLPAFQFAHELLGSLPLLQLDLNQLLFSSLVNRWKIMKSLEALQQSQKTECVQAGSRVGLRELLPLHPLV
jgi:hypothetical protein